MQYLCISSATLIIFIISLIGGKKQITPADRILMAWLTIFLINVVTIFLVARDGYAPRLLHEKFLFEFSEASIFLHGPFFWYYTLALTRPDFDFKSSSLLHGILFLIAFLLLIWGALYQGSINFGIRKGMILLKMLSALIYTIAVVRRLKKHQMTILDIFSNTEEKKLDWLYFLCYGILFIWSMSVVSLLLSVFSKLSTPQFINWFPNAALVVFIYLMGYFGIRQNHIFLKQDSIVYPLETPEPETPHKTIPTPQEKYVKSGLSRIKADAIYRQLVEYMEAERPYLDPDITLFWLSEKLKVQPNHLSQVINGQENQNFFDYINSFRVRSIKSEIHNGKLKTHTLLGLAFDCGFNSKASFNRAFKKHTGITPTEFKNQQNTIDRSI